MQINSNREDRNILREWAGVSVLSAGELRGIFSHLFLTTATIMTEASSSSRNLANRAGRTVNFSMYEKELIAELTKKYSAILLKSKDAKVIRQKEEQWQMLVKEYNSDKLVTVMRDAASIRMCLKNLTTRAKKEHAQTKKSLFRTGGGPPCPEPSATTSALVGLLQTTMEPLNVPDSDQVHDPVQQENQGK
jgi:hypothetical protein